MRFVAKNRLGFYLLKAKLQSRNLPLLVFFTITNNCNARCSYCFGQYYQRYNAQKEQELTTEQVFSIIDQLSKMGTCRIGISGGEPLMRQDIGEIIDYILSKGISCGLNTNGYLIHQTIQVLRKLDSITVSLDGDEAVHDQLRGAGSFKKVMQAIQLIKQYGIPLHVNTVLTKTSLDSLDYLMGLAKKTGFLVQISPLYTPVWGEQPKNFPQQLNNEEFAQTIKRIVSYKNRGYPVFYSHQTYRNILAWPDLAQQRIIQNKPSFRYARCQMGRYLCTIDANGDVYPCGQLSGFKAQNSLKVGFQQAFAHLARHQCRACIWACYNEYNLLFALSLQAIGNLLKNSIYDFRQRRVFAAWKRNDESIIN